MKFERPPINRYIRKYAEKLGDIALGTESDPEQEATPANIQYFEVVDEGSEV